MDVMCSLIFFDIFTLSQMVFGTGSVRMLETPPMERWWEMAHFRKNTPAATSEGIIWQNSLKIRR